MGIHKKCPWKHLLELEDFLISNRVEYMAHLAMNYTAKQRQYNKQLTERLLYLAEHHKYAFNEADFDCVILRDNIRCYYLSTDL